MLCETSIQIITGVDVISENYFPDVDKILLRGRRLRQYFINWGEIIFINNR